MAKAKKGYNVLAIIGFIFSFFGFFAFIGIILCIAALLSIKKEKGRGLAIAGIFVGVFMFSISILGLGFLFFFLNRGVVRGSGNVISQSYDVTEFKSVQLEGMGDMYVTQQDDYSLSIKTDDNILRELTVGVRGDTLVIGRKANFVSMKPSDSIEIRIGAPLFERITVSGAGKVVSRNKIVGDKLTLTVSGASDSDLSLDVDRLYTAISGSGSCTYGGNVRNHHITITGMGNIHAYDLNSESVQIEVSGAGNADLAVTDTLDITVSGSANINYVGDPVISQSVSGVANIEKVE